MSRDEYASEEIAAHLLRREKSLLDPAVRRDSIQVAALLAEDFVEFGSSGRKRSRDQIICLLAVEEFTPPAIEDFECRYIAAGVALATYRTVRTDPETHNRSVTLRSSLWTNESGDWLLCFHQGTRAA